jgi:hypothetical protein
MLHRIHSPWKGFRIGTVITQVVVNFIIIRSRPRPPLLSYDNRNMNKRVCFVIWQSKHEQKGLFCFVIWQSKHEQKGLFCFEFMLLKCILILIPLDVLKRCVLSCLHYSCTTYLYSSSGNIYLCQCVRDRRNYYLFEWFQTFLQPIFYHRTIVRSVCLYIFCKISDQIQIESITKDWKQLIGIILS